MRSLALRPLLFGALTLGLAGCPGDDSGDDSNDSANDTTTSATSAGTAEDTTTNNPTTAGDDTTTAADTTTTGELVLADVEVTVNYEGEATGLLSVVALTSFPPEGPPVSAVSEMDPAFPFMGTLNDIELGEYFIVAVLDVGEPNPTIPGPEDLLVATEAPLVIDGEGPFMVELTLTDAM